MKESNLPVCLPLHHKSKTDNKVYFRTLRKVIRWSGCLAGELYDFLATKGEKGLLFPNKDISALYGVFVVIKICNTSEENLKGNCTQNSGRKIQAAFI